LFLWPVFVIVPPQATAPALVVVGVLMMQGLARIDLAQFENTIPIVLTLFVTVLTNNLINGMALGTLSFILISLATGRAREISGVIWGLGVVFVAYFYVTTRLM
jgi:AGZA family xanthine/uracil permease-like MFS transporter